MEKFIGLEVNKADLVRLLSEELSFQVADEDIVTAGGFESLEMVKLSPGNDPGILSATHETDTFCFMQKTRKCTYSNELSLFIKKLKRWCFYFISNISFRVNMVHNMDKEHFKCKHVCSRQ